MPWAPTDRQLLNLDGVPMRADRFRFDLIRDDEVAGQLDPGTESPPVITVDTTAAVKRTMTGFNLPASDLVEINPLRDRVQATAVLQSGTEFGLGRFMWASDGRPLRAWGTEHRSTLADESLQLNQGSSRSEGWGVGANVIVIAVYLASRVFPPERIIYDPSDTVLGTSVAYPVGSVYLRSLDECMERLGYLPPHLDRDGFLRLVEPPTLDVSPGADALVYDVGNSRRVIADSVYLSDDLIEAPNRFQVFESSGQGGGLRGIYDIPASAPHSYAQRGFYVTDTESVTGLASTAQANKAAKTRALTHGAAYKYATWESPADYRHDVFDVVHFGDSRAAAGTHDPGPVSPWLEYGHRLVCTSGGTHEHNARKVYDS